MRREFKEILYNKIKKNNKIKIICPDLGYKFFDEIRKDFPDNFIQLQATENLALGIAVGLSLSGFIPIVYSITPFLISTPHSFLRNYLNHEKIPVKLCAGGRGCDYEHDGYTHYCGDDKDILDTFEEIKCFWPEKIEDLESTCEEWLNNGLPSYLNLKR